METTYQIESGIQIPARRYGRQGEAAPYPFMRMKVGDSFLIKQNGGGKAALEKQRVYALLYAKAHKIHVTTRKVDGGIRVWKVRGGL